MNMGRRLVGSGPLYQQLYEHVRAAILAGELKGGSALPSSRALADEWGVSRNTVLNAYAQLTAEGYLESVAGQGTYVARGVAEMEKIDLTPQPPLHNGRGGGRQRAGHSPAPTTETEKTPESENIENIRLSDLAEAIVGMRPLTPADMLRGRALFHPAVPALDAFPFELWGRLVAKHARRIPPQMYTVRDTAGYRPLREAIAEYATVSRRVRCTPDQIIMVAGAQGGFNLVARVLLNSGDGAWMEDPGYMGGRGALVGVGATIADVPVDDEGLNVEAGIQMAPHAKLAYVTPSHQFPLGVTLSLGRRLALLEWARRVGAFILEDDYDSEYRFSGRPLASLQGLDGGERVIYVGTFSKVMFPALRLGYLIVPPPLVQAFLAVRAYMDFQPPILEQTVLAEFIAAGHFGRHLRRMRQLYAARRRALIEALAGLPLEIEAGEAGLNLVAWLPDGVNAEWVAGRAREQGVDVVALSVFAMRPYPREGLLIGYAGVKPEEMAGGMEKLGRILKTGGR